VSATTRHDDAAPEHAAKAAFVERFAAGWAGGADTLADTFLPDLAREDVVLTQPLLPTARGHAGFRRQFELLFGAMPDLRGEVLGWRATHDGVEVKLALAGTLDGLPVRFTTRDRIVLHDGRMCSRHARIDMRPLLFAMARRPRAALPLIAASLPGRG
jgi:ketosteroid isomerase-like protein